MPVGAEDVYLAAGGGHLEALRWMREHDCEWDAGGLDFWGKRYKAWCTLGRRLR